MDGIRIGPRNVVTRKLPCLHRHWSEVTKLIRVADRADAGSACLHACASQNITDGSCALAAGTPYSATACAAAAAVPLSAGRTTPAANRSRAPWAATVACRWWS